MPAKEIKALDLSTIQPIRPVLSDAPQTKVSLEEMISLQEDMKARARYKIELIFSRHRSSRPHVPSPVMLIIWESGKRLHGGGDQKMYWCGYDDCGKPMSTDNFAYMHAICPSCHRELFLDPESKRLHIQAIKRERGNLWGIKSIPLVVGEKLANLTPPHLSELLEKTWRQLDGDADIYLKFSPQEIRYDGRNETSRDLDNLDNVRMGRRPLIYSLKRIIKDLGAGADLKSRILAMITS